MDDATTPMDDATTPMASEQQSDPLLPPLPSTLHQYTFQPSAPLEHASAPPLYPHMTGTLPNAEWSDNVPHECAADITLSSFSAPSAPPLYPVLQDTSSPSPYPSLIGHNPITSSPASYTPKTTVLPSFAYVLPIRNGLSRNELHDLYRPPSDISDILSDFERRSTMAVHNNDLYDYMNAYERASASAQQTNLALFRLQQKAKGYAGKLWTVRTKTEVVQAACADGATISHSYSYQIGNYEPDMAAKLKKSLQRLMVKKSRLLVRQKFEEMTCRLWIEDKISSVLNNASWATQDHHKERRDSDMFREDLEIVKKYLDVLFYFERTVRRQPDFDDGDKETLEEIKTEKTSSDAENADGTGAADDADQSPNGVILSIRRWITLLVAAILEYGNYSDRIYLLMHVFRSRHAATWSATFLQCTIPKHWSDPFLDYYLLQYSLILCGPSPLTTKEEGVTLLWGQNLDEDDYLAIIDQLDIPIFFQRLVDHYCSPSSSNSGKVHRGYVERRCLRVLAICHSMFDWTITGLERHLQYPVMAKRLVQTLCQLCQILGDHLMVLHLPVEGSLSLQSAMTPIQIEIDNLFLRVIRAIIGLPSHGLWNFLPSIPFQFMSHHAIITLLEETALENIESWIMNPVKLLETSPESNHLRTLLGRNPSEGVFFLTALALMAQSKLDSHGPQIEDLMTQEQILGFRMAEIITFLLVDVAFLDSDIRSELAKPTREILASLCDSATDLIPIMLRIVDRHFEELGTMAFYLFKELPLEEWNIGEQDFAILVKLLEHQPLGSPESMFAQHVLGSLDWGHTQRIDGTLISGPPHGHVPLALHKELALSLADICIAYMNRTVVTAASTTDTVKPMETTPPNSSTPPEATDIPATPLSTSFTADQGLLSSFTSAIPQAVVNLAANSGIHSLTEHSAWKSFMDWAWSMLVKLRMIDVPVLSLRQASRLHFQDTNGFFSKAPVLNQGQQAFVKAVHLMLTEASRDPESFALEGWTTLSSVLQADQGVALISMLCDILPMLMSVQKDEGEPQYTKFAVMLQEIANHKPDPMLALAGHAIAEATIQFPVNNVPVDLLGIWVIMRRSLSFATLSDTAGSPFSTTHQSIDDERAKKVLQFWLSSVFAQKDWMMHSEFVQIMDLICLTADELGLEGFVKDLLLEQQILLSIGYRRSPGMSGEIMGIAQPKLDRVMDLLPERLSRALPIPQGSNDPSLLVGSWSVKTFATTLFTQQPMVETKSFWFAYQVLKVETHLEREMRMKVGLHYEQHPEELDVRGNIKTIVKKLGITNRKTIFNFSIWRWVQHLLVLPMDHTLQPLYWYMFFNLYFSHTHKDHVFYGYKFLESSTPMLDGDSIIGQLKDRLQKLYTRFGQEARKCIQSKQVNRAEKLTKLHDLYLAMFGWLSEPLLLSSEIELHRIRKDLLPDRLATCRLTDQQECNADLWRDLLVPQVLTSEMAQQQTASKNKPEQKLQHSSSPSSPQSRRPSFFAKAMGHTSSQADSPGSRPQSRLSPRMQRKQSYPRHEQKISTCLVQQAKPGPACCTPALLIRIPSLLDRETNVDGLFREIAQTFKDCAKAYFNTMETYKYLDKSYLDELQALYHNEARTKRLDIACDSTPNTLCKKPAVFELRFEEIVTNEKVRGLVVDNRTRIQELNVGSVDTNLCLAALKAAKIIEEMLDLLTPSQKSDDYQSKKSPSTLEGEAREKLHQLAVESFYFIHGELLKDAENGYPPAQLILERTVDSLGKRIVAFNASQTESVLDLMGTSSFTISLLHQIFNPANEPKKFVQYYKRIATCKEYELSSKDLLLQQFDVFAWACPENSDPSETMDENIITVMDRLAFYEVAFTAMKSQQQQEQQDKEISERELRTMDRLAIIKSHRELAGTLLLNFLGEDYINYLRILLDTCAITCLEPEVIQDYIRILGVDPRLVLSLLDGSHVNYQPGEMQATVDASNSSSGPQLSTIEKRQQQLRNRKGYRDQTLERQEAARKGMTRLGLSDYDLGCLVRFLEDYFTQCQESMAHGNLLDRYNGYVIYIADLIAIVLCDERFLTQWMDQSACAASNAISYNQSQQQPLYDAPNLCPLWRDTLRVFKPWLSCLAEHAVDEIRFQRQQGGASRILFTFVGIVNKALESIYRHFQDPSWSEISLFDTYLNIVQGGIGSQGTVNQVMLLHQHFRRLDWKQLEWSCDAVSRMLYIHSKLDVETRAEFWTYLVTVIMDKIQAKLWGQHSWDTQAGPFELSMLRLGLCILQDIGQVTRRDRELETLFLYRI
ncbi:Ectopic P granules protein 5, partial [Actinomortierella wolfii]